MSEVSISESSQSHIRIERERSEARASLEAACLGATIGSPKLIAMNDIEVLDWADREWRELQMLRTEALNKSWVGRLKDPAPSDLELESSSTEVILARMLIRSHRVEYPGYEGCYEDIDTSFSRLKRAYRAGAKGKEGRVYEDEAREFFRDLIKRGQAATPKP